MGINRYNGNEWYTSLYMGTAFNYTKEQNREHLLEEIRTIMLSDKQDNMKIIAEEVKQYGGHEISFVNGCHDAILIGAFTTNEDYYYLYYDIHNSDIRATSGVDSIAGDWNGRRISALYLDTQLIDKCIDEYFKKNYWYEVPFTPIFKSNSWTFPFVSK